MLLSQIFDGVIITLGGFAVFNSKEKQALLRQRLFVELDDT